MTKDEVVLLSPIQMMSEYVCGLVVGLVDEPGAVRVHAEFKYEHCLLLHVTVAQADLGKVIGQGGRTARSLRTIIEAACRKMQLRCELNLGDGPARTAGVDMHGEGGL